LTSTSQRWRPSSRRAWRRASSSRPRSLPPRRRIRCRYEPAARLWNTCWRLPPPRRSAPSQVP